MRRHRQIGQRCGEGTCTVHRPQYSHTVHDNTCTVPYGSRPQLSASPLVQSWVVGYLVPTAHQNFFLAQRAGPAAPSFVGMKWRGTIVARPATGRRRRRPCLDNLLHRDTLHATVGPRSSETSGDQRSLVANPVYTPPVGWRGGCACVGCVRRGDDVCRL